MSSCSRTSSSFFILLNYHIKRNAGAIAAVAAWLLVSHYLDIHWLVIPRGPQAGVPFSYMDIGALLAVGGLSVAFAAARLRGKHIVPINDPALPEALEYESV